MLKSENHWSTMCLSQHWQIFLVCKAYCLAMFANRYSMRRKWVPAQLAKNPPPMQETHLISRLGRSPGEGIGYLLQYSWTSLVAQMVKNPPEMWETWVQSLGWEDPLEESKATPFQYSCLENSHGQRSLVGYSPWGHKESDTTEWLSIHTGSRGEVCFQDKDILFNFQRTRCLPPNHPTFFFSDF